VHSVYSQRKGKNFCCKSHRRLGNIHTSKRESEKAIHHFEAALRIASTVGWPEELVLINFHLAILSHFEDRLDDANAYLNQAESYTVDPYNLGGVMWMRAVILGEKRRFGDATSEALGALQIFEKLGAARDLEKCCSRG
jgi:tetratricopeptide (TPR) repeat protein